MSSNPLAPRQPNKVERKEAQDPLPIRLAVVAVLFSIPLFAGSLFNLEHTPSVPEYNKGFDVEYTERKLRDDPVNPGHMVDSPKTYAGFGKIERPTEPDLVPLNNESPAEKEVTNETP